MAAINSGSGNNNSTSGGGNNSTGGSNMYRVGDYVYFETQQQQQQPSHHQQPFQIRRIEELNKTAGGNVEAKVMCFYRRRDLPAQLVALADKHQQHQQQQQLSFTSSSGKSGKQVAAIKATSTDGDITKDKNEEGSLSPSVKKEQKETKEESENGASETTKTVKEENRQQDVEMTDTTATDSAPTVDDGDTKVEGNDGVDVNDKDISEEKKAAIADTQAAQQQQDWWRGEQLKQRELFLSRQVETLAATHIRGKCTVTLYNETESLDSYLEREDTFFYCLVFDPVQKTLLADKGEIRVGHKYQAEVPPKALYNYGDLRIKDTVVKAEIVKEESTEVNEPIVTECDDDEKDNETKSITTISTVAVPGAVTESDFELETLVWTCRPQWNRLTDRQIDQFLVVSRSLGTFARALDCTSSVKQPSLHMSAAAASRDITLFHAMDTLHKHGYDLGAATCSLVPSTGPVLCRDEMEEWSASEANLFEEALEKYGKDFGDIRHDFLPWKTHKNIVEYYYMWKTTDRYVQQKRVKAVEQESKLKQVYIPSYNGTSTSSGKQQAITAGASVKSSQQLVNGNSSAMELYSGKNSGTPTGPLLPGACDLCDAVASQLWYPNTIGATAGTGSYHQQNGGLSSVSSLCHECWTHWKKYGGPRTATSDKKAITGRGDSVSGDEDRPHSNASSGSASAAMNLNISAGGGRSSSHTPTAPAPHHHHHLMHLGGSSSHHGYHHQSQHHQQHHQQQPSPSSHQQSGTSSSGGGGLLHQPHINSSGSSSSTHRCTIIGCQSPAFKSKSQLLRHYSAAHGIGINSNSGASPTIPAGISSRSGDGVSGALSPQPQLLLQQQPIGGGGGSGLMNSGPLNLNSNAMQQQSNATSATNQVMNLVSASQQLQPNNLSTGGGGGVGATVTGAVNAVTGRPVMKTRTAFYLRCTSLTKASRRRAAQQAAAALQLQQKKSPGTLASVSPLATTVQPGCLARPRNVARRPFTCVPQAAHAYKHECMLSMQHAPVHELRAYLRAAAVKAHSHRPGVTRVANLLIAARRGRGGASSTAADLAVPDWLSLPSQQHHQSSHHHVSSSSGSKHGKHHSSSRTSSGGRVAFPKPPKAADGSLLYERVPNKQEAAAALNNPSAAAAAAAAAAAVGLNPAAAAAILGALGPPGAAGGTGSPNDPSLGFDVAAAAAALYQQQQQQQQQQNSSSSNKRRLYETDGGAQQPQPQVGPPSKRMHRQHHSQQSSATGHHHSQHQSAALHGGAVDGMLASLVAHQQQQQQRGAALQLTSGGRSSGGGKAAHQQQVTQQNHYRTPSMARTGRKHVISWTDAPDDMYYKVVPFVKALRKAKMPRRELKRWGRKPWLFIPELGGISFRMPPSASAPPAQVAPGTAPQSTPTASAPPVAPAAVPFDMSTTSSRLTSATSQSSPIVVPSATSGLSSRTSGGHH